MTEDTAQPASGVPPEDASADGEVMTRDLGTISEDGPNLTAMESPVARRGALASLMAQRPTYSPVAQPGMNEEIWYHTVRSEKKAHEAGKPARRMKKQRRWRRRGGQQLSVPPNQSGG